MPFGPIPSGLAVCFSPRRFLKPENTGKPESDLTEAGIGIRITALGNPAVRKPPRSMTSLIHL
jgi:hypothetical protein